MYQHFSPGSEAGIAIAKCINLAFDGDIEGASEEIGAAVRKLISIENSDTRKRTADYAIEVAYGWLDLADDDFATVEAVRSADPFWFPRKPKETPPGEAASLYTAGTALAKALSQACNGKPSDAVATFPKAVSLLNQLSSVGERFDAADFAFQTAYRGYESVANVAWQDIVDAAKLIDEDAIDIAFAHLVQAIDGLANISDDIERAKAVSITRKNGEITLGPRYKNTIQSIRPMLSESGFDWKGLFADVYNDLSNVSN